MGSLLRHVANISFERYAHIPLPLASLCVNIIGSFILGFLFVYFMHKTHNESLRLALTVGFCGGLSTFSTFSLEVFNLLKDGQTLAALSYIALSVVVCLVMVALGIALASYVLKVNP